MLNEKKAGNSILQKTASSSELQNYFTAIFDLRKSGKEFPINLDEVWRLVYNKKQDAVNFLKNNFLENKHYEVFRQKAENPKSKGGRPKIDYFLSTQCLEYFIAKKKREVFEVYRKVFHQAVENKQKAITAEASYVEGEIFLGKLGRTTIKGIFKNEQLWYEMSAVIKHLYGNYSSSNGTFLTKSPSENFMKHKVHNQERWFLNMQAIDDILVNYYLTVTHSKVSILFKDLFNVKRSEVSNESTFEYAFTGSEMAEILFAIQKTPINKAEVTRLLEKGKEVPNA